MRVTYLNHSGFLLEWEDCYWIFDYYKGELPALDKGKTVFVFCSHSHGDHFNPEIFTLLWEHPSVRYVFSNEIRKKVRKMQKTEGASRQELPEIMFLQARTDEELPDGAGDVTRIHTLQSTDCGCAFVLSYKGRTVYHAGDLHWWTWPGEPEADNRKMEADYKKEIEYLAGKTVDLAFTPLDPRQEEDYAKGICYLLRTVKIRHIVPMHFWDDFSVMGKFEREYVNTDKLCGAVQMVRAGDSAAGRRLQVEGVSEQADMQNVQFYELLRDGQSWELEL